MGKAENSRLHGNRHFLTSFFFYFLREHNFDLVVLADLSQTISFVSDSGAALWCWPSFILH